MRKFSTDANQYSFFLSIEISINAFDSDSEEGHAMKSMIYDLPRSPVNETYLKHSRTNQMSMTCVRK